MEGNQSSCRIREHSQFRSIGILVSCISPQLSRNCPVPLCPSALAFVGRAVGRSNQPLRGDISEPERICHELQTPLAKSLLPGLLSHSRTAGSGRWRKLWRGADAKRNVEKKFLQSAGGEKQREDRLEKRRDASERLGSLQGRRRRKSKMM